MATVVYFPGVAPVAAGPFWSLCGLDQAAAWSSPWSDQKGIMRQLEKRETELLEHSICETFAKIQNIFDGSGNFNEDCRVYAMYGLGFVKRRWVLVDFRGFFRLCWCSGHIELLMPVQEYRQWLGVWTHDGDSIARGASIAQNWNRIYRFGVSGAAFPRTLAAGVCCLWTWKRREGWERIWWWTGWYQCRAGDANPGSLCRMPSSWQNWLCTDASCGVFWKQQWTWTFCFAWMDALKTQTIWSNFYRG